MCPRADFRIAKKRSTVNVTDRGSGMADIFLSYGGAQFLIEAFEASLTRQGHKVYSDENFGYRRGAIIAKLHEFDAVIVIWSENSISRALSLDIAAEASRLGRLIQVRAPDVSSQLVPDAFGSLPSFAVSETQRIAEAIAALGVAPGPKSAWPRRPPAREGVGAAAGSPYRVDPPGIGSSGVTRPRVLPQGVGSASSPEIRSTTISPAGSEATNALEIEAGRLVHKIPAKMWVGEQETVEVRLGRLATPDLSKGLEGRGSLTTEDIPIVETMSVSLYGGSGAFTIERQSETSQLVMSNVIKGTPLETEDFGRWVWLVTPRKTGTHQLFVKVSAALKDSRGVPTTTKLPDKEFKVAVSIHTGKTTVAVIKRSLPTLILAGLGGLVAAFTRDVWWPKLYALLKGLGWFT